jgi:hypothetical protein
MRIATQVLKQGIEFQLVKPRVALQVRPLEPLESLIDFAPIRVDLSDLVGRVFRMGRKSTSRAQRLSRD